MATSHRSSFSGHSIIQPLSPLPPFLAFDSCYISAETWLTLPLFPKYQACYLQHCWKDIILSLAINIAAVSATWWPAKLLLFTSCLFDFSALSVTPHWHHSNLLQIHVYSVNHLPETGQLSLLRQHKPAATTNQGIVLWMYLFQAACSSGYLGDGMEPV